MFMKLLPRRSGTSGQKGFSMIEILITLVVTSIGILSLVLFQARAMQYSHSSYQRSIAIMQANDFVERLWAGACALPAGFDDIKADWIGVHSNDPNGLPGWNGDDTDVDVAQDTPEYSITIRWSDDRLRFDMTNAAEVDQVFTYAARIPSLNCD